MLEKSMGLIKFMKFYSILPYGEYFIKQEEKVGCLFAL